MREDIRTFKRPKGDSMATRPVASLTISFGLISIPVDLFSATQSGGKISFNLLHKKCGSRLKQQYICQKEGVVVERDEMVKGYEFSKDRYVQFTPEEIKEFDEAGTHTVEIEEFVALEAVDPVYYDRTYYMTPDKRAAKAYALLAEALSETRRCAIGRWAARGNSNIVMVRPVGNVLALQQLHFSYEVRPVTEFEVPEQAVKASEVTLAKQLIEQLSSDSFDPTAYTDEVRSRIEAAIQKKIKGEKFTLKEKQPVVTDDKVIDLMAVLRASLAKNKDAKSSVSKLGARKAPKRVDKPVKAARKANRG